MKKQKRREAMSSLIGDNNAINNNSPCKAQPHLHPFRNPKPQMKKQKRREAMSSLKEKEMEKAKEICIGDSNGNNSHRRNWCSDLPMDALLLIMSKVGAIYILLSAQWVCKNWGKICREVPSLWRNIDMTSYTSYMSSFDIYNIYLKRMEYGAYFSRMAREAIDRAQGNVQQFDILYFGDDELLQYLAHSTSLLRRLRLIETYDSTEKGLAESVSRFPLLEELHIKLVNYDKEVCELVGKACPHLKCFGYIQQSYESDDEEDEEALGIANYMPNLRHLQIVGNKLSNVGLMAILDKCVHLQSLDLRCCFKINMDASLRARLTCVHLQSLDLRNCFNIKMDASLRARCARIKDLRYDPPYPTDDY